MTALGKAIVKFKKVKNLDSFIVSLHCQQDNLFRSHLPYLECFPHLSFFSNIMFHAALFIYSILGKSIYNRRLFVCLFVCLCVTVVSGPIWTDLTKVFFFSFLL